jgi:peroxiredoxin Q/BCP
MASPARGDKAPDFTLPGTECPGPGDGAAAGSRGRCNERLYTLSEQRGGVTVLVFYPGDATPVCTIQLRSYSDDFAQFEGLGATVWAISPQDLDSHKDFASDEGFRFPLLADTGKEVGRAYGILGPIGFYRRSVFVVDAEGIVRYAHRATSGLSFRPTTELVEAVRSSL